MTPGYEERCQATGDPAAIGGGPPGTNDRNARPSEEAPVSENEEDGRRIGQVVQQGRVCRGPIDKKIHLSGRTARNDFPGRSGGSGAPPCPPRPRARQGGKFGSPCCEGDPRAAEVVDQGPKPGWAHPGQALQDEGIDGFPGSGPRLRSSGQGPCRSHSSWGRAGHHPSTGASGSSAGTRELSPDTSASRREAASCRQHPSSRWFTPFPVTALMA